MLATNEEFSHRSGVRPRTAFLVILALSFLALSCWSFASPLVAGPDEQSHIIRADALAHGQLGHPATPGEQLLVTVTVPQAIYFSKLYPGCWQFLGNNPATCAPSWTTSQAPIATTVYVGHYPPLYYAIVGTGTYFSQQKAGIYAMRLVSSLLSALMLALGAYAIVRWSRRKMIVAGVFMALTPMSLFLSSVVNPSGFEIVSAICLWTALAIFVMDYPIDPPRGLVTVIAVSASVFALIRGLSPLWVGLAGIVAIMAVGWREIWALLRRRHDVRVAVGVIGAAFVVALTWITTQGTLHILPVGVPVPKGSSELHIIRMTLGALKRWRRESIGVLGWLDTGLPNFLYSVWYLMIVGAFIGGLWRSSWRQRLALILASGLALFMPVVIVAREARVNGIVWQGRDSLPITVGAIILAVALCANLIRSARLERWGVSCIVVVVALLNLIAFYANLRRYAVGRMGGRLFFLHNVGWSPPTGQFATLFVYGVLTAVITALVLRWVWVGSVATPTTSQGD